MVSKKTEADKENGALVAPKARAKENQDKVESMDISSNVLEAVPKENIPSIEDIDIEDAGNPQLVVEYVQDIYNYLRLDNTASKGLGFYLYLF